MEKLLNELLKRGWKPFGIKSDNMCLYCLKDYKIVISYYDFDTEWECNHEDKRCSYRELVNKKSWLWQFVCENEMIVLKLSARMENPRMDWEDVDDYNNWHIVMKYKQKCESDKAEYRIIESALCNEEDLEQFLLDNIKVEWK